VSDEGDAGGRLRASAMLRTPAARHPEAEQPRHGDRRVGTAPNEQEFCPSCAAPGTQLLLLAWMTALEAISDALRGDLQEL